MPSHPIHAPSSVDAGFRTTAQPVTFAPCARVPLRCSVCGAVEALLPVCAGWRHLRQEDSADGRRGRLVACGGMWT